MGSVSMLQFECMCEQYVKLDNEIGELEAQKKKLRAEQDVLEQTIIAVMEEFDKTNYQAAGKKFILTQRASVKIPREIEEKQAFYDWLKREKGEDVYWHYCDVNSQKLNSLYKAERDVAVDKGNFEFKIPGVGDEKITKIISLRKG